MVAGVAVIVVSLLAQRAWISKAGLLADGDTKNDNQDDGAPSVCPTLRPLYSPMKERQLLSSFHEGVN